MQISIVTAVFNRVSTIADALRSVEVQSYQNVEHIIQDGGSTDGTLDVIRQFSSSSPKLVSEPDGGIYDAINKGISRASGNIIGLMHSDDFFADDLVLERVAEAFRDRHVDGVYGDLDYVSASNTGKIVRHWRSEPYHADLLKRGWMPPHPTLYLRREVFDRWGLYDTSMRIAADYEAMLRYLVRGDIRLAYIPEVLVKMRVGGESNRSLSRILRKSREDYTALQRHGVGGINSLLFKNFSKVEQFFPRKGIPK
ncbi:MULTISPECIES: glycosyltransferase family 2 protein [unclassified Sulfitobacter]|uniref:glycosyltransferase family 2 protein n=1 Tax=unclassified Sulfitobacter TaxID=196795 RepID=UPI003745E7B2